MNKSILKTIAAGFLAGALSAGLVHIAQADTMAQTPAAYCGDLGELAYQAASERDLGLTQRESARIAVQAFYDAGVPHTDALFQLSLATIDGVYEEPHLPPREEQGRTFGICMNIYGEGDGYEW